MMSKDKWGPKARLAKGAQRPKKVQMTKKRQKKLDLLKKPILQEDYWQNLESFFSKKFSDLTNHLRTFY